MKGIFVSFEGIDGCGKTSIIPAVQAILAQKGYSVVLTREPGGTELAENLRAMLLYTDMSPTTEAMLMFAARRDHVERVILPALEQGKAVISDRFVDSSYAYQLGGKGVDPTIMAQLEAMALETPAGLVMPDLTLWFDLNPEVARERRILAREPDKFESKETEFFSRVHDEYAKRYWQAPDRIRHIDASVDRESVAQQATEMIHAFLAQMALSKN